MDIGTWKPDLSSAIGSNPYNYQGFVTSRPGEYFVVAAPFRISGEISFDGCFDQPNGIDLVEAKGDHTTKWGGNLFVESWSRQPNKVLSQGRDQAQTVSLLRASHPGSTISLNWYTQTQADQGYIRDIFSNEVPPIPITVNYRPGGR